MTTRWDERIARARELAAKYPATADVLTFYAALAEYQRSLLDRWRRAHRSAPSTDGSFGDDLGLDSLLCEFPDFLSWVKRVAPRRLADATSAPESLDGPGWHRVAISHLSHRRDGRDDVDGITAFVVEAVLQPVAEHVAARRSVANQNGPRFHTPSVCPICGGDPVAGVLREAGHGAKRTLLCPLCLREWEFLRVVCPRCGEQQFSELPVYTAEQFAHVRIEACDRCRRYLKTIDLTKDGLAVPLVDDFASLPLDLWAREQGYVRLRANLLGL